MDKFWPKFQSYVGNTVPEFIVNILISAGYDSALSIADLNDNDIAVIENHVSQKLAQKSADLLQNSDLYSETNPFQFLPGHRKLLLTLKSRAISFIEDNRKPNKKHTKVPLIEAERSNIEELELLTDEELNVMKNELLQKLSALSHTISLGLKFEDKNIVTSIDAYISNNSKKLNNYKKSNTPSYKCSVKCVKCERVIPCTHNIRWETGNIEKHLKTHTLAHVSPTVLHDTISNNITNINRELDPESTLTSTTESTLPTNTKSNLSKEAQRQLKNILRS